MVCAPIISSFFWEIIVNIVQTNKSTVQTNKTTHSRLQPQRRKPPSPLSIIHELQLGDGDLAEGVALSSVGAASEEHKTSVEGLEGPSSG